MSSMAWVAFRNLRSLPIPTEPRTPRSYMTGSVGKARCTTQHDVIRRPPIAVNPLWGSRTFGFDGLSRVTQVTQPDGSLIQTSYTGNSTTITDEAGKKHKSVADGLGRLTQVFEDPSGLNYETVYTYDALDDLAAVVQAGSHNRNFVSDSLKRLTSASNPESGTVAYTYDANNNVLTKKDARSVTTTYSYDKLNRMTAKTYTDGTATISYVYDGNAPTACSTGVSSYGLAVGRRTAMCDAAGVEAWTYNDIPNTGWQVVDKRTTNGVTESMASQKNLGGSLYQTTYPSGRIITYQPGGAGRPLSAVDSADSINYIASGADYTPHGALGFAQNGAGLYSTFIYNNRLQACWMYTTTTASNSPPWNTTPCTGTATTGNILDLKYNFSLGAGDNGNVVGITNNRVPNRSQSFAYDNLNRITNATTTATHANDPTDCWGEAYVYDNQASGGAWGNLTNINVASSAYNGCTQETLSQTVLANNQISGFCYDASGNLLAEGSCPGGPPYTFNYNAENQLTSTAGVTYTYDGDGRRVEKSNGTLYWYGGGSDPIAESSLTGANMDEYVFFGGKRIAHRKSTGEIDYYAADHLGTSRVVVNSSGTILDDSDFYPFGGERPAIPATSGNTFKFTGKERDSESGLDNFGARYDSSSLGRFMTPDSPSYSNHKNPQSWNLYAYALNNPITFRDADGHKIECANYAEQCKKDAAASTANAQAASRVTTETSQHGWWIFKWTETSIKITGDINSFRALSPNAAKLADLVTSKDTVTVSYGASYSPAFGESHSLEGGSTSVTATQHYLPQAFIDPNPRSGSIYDPDAVENRVPQANTGEEFAHEVLGHIWGDMFGGAPAGTRGNMRDSIAAEDAVRALDPTRGQKPIESHHNYQQAPE